MTDKNFLIIGDATKQNNIDDNLKFKQLNDGLRKNKHVFLFIFMDGCGPCNMTKEPWDEIEKKLNNNENDYIVARVNSNMFNKIENIGDEPSGYPSLRYINGDNVQEYEESDIDTKDRSTDSFIKWIESKRKNKDNSKSMTGGRRKTRKIEKKKFNNLTKTKTKSRKWSLKYKKSINCRKPKGFSQKQYCKYGRNKNINKKYYH